MYNSLKDYIEQNNLTDRDTEKLIAYLLSSRDLPKAPHERVLSLEEMRCSSCGKIFPAGDAKPFDTGVVKGVDPICPDCRKNLKGLSYIVCVGCKEIVGRLVPNKLRSGFQLQPDHYYHIVHCPECNPSAFPEGSQIDVPIIEEKIYKKKIGIKD